MESSKTFKLIENKKIAIVGAGPGGLTLARLLQMRGANVTVYERDFSQNARVQGAIVDLHYDSGLMVMEAAGLMNAFKEHYMAGADRYRMLDKNGNILVDEHSQASDVGFGDEHFRPEIDRGALRDMLIGALLPNTVVWNSQFEGMELLNDVWQIQFKNGSTAAADIVIGAEGYRSKIRPYITEIAAQYSGAAIIQGEIENPEIACPEVYALVDHANLIAMDIGKTIAVQPMGNGGLTFYASSLYPENWIENSGVDFNNKDEVLTYLSEFYQNWSPMFLSLFRACKRFVPRPLNYFPLDQHWEAKPNITLIGDAAHLMPPSGEGVNTAMLDALDLSACLTSDEYDNLKQAIRAYEEKMLARAAVLGQEALDGIKDFSSPSEESIQKMIQLFSSHQE